MKYVRLADTPDALLKEITARLHSYSTALFRLETDPNGQEQATHIGAGTFVTIEGADGILTATHVSDKLFPGSQLALLAAREGQAHNFRIDRSNLTITPVAKRLTDDFGPDASFVGLSDWDDVGTIKASRAFHPLDSDREEILERPPSRDSGIWFICGTPEERVAIDEWETGFDQVITLESYCGGGGIDSEFESQGIDYMEFPIIDEGTDPVTDFSGMSGGALWQVTVREADDGSLASSRFLLFGVIFFQDTRSDGTHYLRCHGAQTIYRHLLAAVSSVYGSKT